VASIAQLHAELIGFLRQHCSVRDQRHLVLLAWIVAGLSLSETVCFDRWKTRLPLADSLAASWQRRCQRWLANRRIDVQALYGRDPLLNRDAGEQGAAALPLTSHLRWAVAPFSQRWTGFSANY
jgi:hypothetical protein